RLRARLGVPGAAAGPAPAAPAQRAADARAGGLGGDRGVADRDLRPVHARRLAPRRAHVGAAVPAQLGPALADADRRPGQVLRRGLIREVNAPLPPVAPSPPSLRVEDPGMFTTVQDLGRPGRRAAGVPPGGAM